MKTIEIILAAVYTLISAALSIVKFIKQISKLKPKSKPKLNFA